jgi:hypothetical protein
VDCSRLGATRTLCDGTLYLWGLVLPSHFLDD